MNPRDFVQKWKNGGDERRDWHSWFNDLCHMLGQQTPREADPEHAWFTYEYGVGKAAGGHGWADAWRKGKFGWEAKGTGKDLTRAYAQLKMYADDLQNPPLLIVCDLHKVEIHTNFTNTVKQVHAFTVEDMVKPEIQRILRAAFENPDELRPDQTRTELTKEVAETFANLALTLRARGEDPQNVAHFLNRLVFAAFAEDCQLLPSNVFTRLLEASQDDPDAFLTHAAELFRAMRLGGSAGFTKIDWFNGGLFDDDKVLRLDAGELKMLLGACKQDWSEIDPSIFGTLFERGLDPDKRSMLGAHYTDPETIMKIIRPVIIEPWLQDWEAEKGELAPLLERADVRGKNATSAAQKSAQTKAYNQARERFVGFLERLRTFTVLDPACGSGNFLFMALKSLKDIEQRVILEAEELGLQREIPGVSPKQVLGIELNTYAAELARITVWIGELQWMIQNGYGARKNPILLPLNQIENRDALLVSTNVPAAWPDADVIVGNPPFLGGSKLKGELGEEYVASLRTTYKGTVPGGADLVCYWFARANTQITSGCASRAGFVATNSIRGGSNRTVLKQILESGRIYEAWSDEPWINEGAAVRVSMICFDGKSEECVFLDGSSVAGIYADLKPKVDSRSSDMTTAVPLEANRGVAFKGMPKDGPLDVPGDLARQWLTMPNPNGKPNSDVLKPRANGKHLTSRGDDSWIIDFGAHTPLAEAAYYEAPFSHVEKFVKPVRQRPEQKDKQRRERWWLFGRSNEDLRIAIAPLERFATTVRHSKHRLWVWMDRQMSPDSALVVVARDDDTTFGILHSKFHELWALRQGTAIGVGNDPRYTPTTSFDTFPFPEGLGPNVSASAYVSDPRAEAIAAVARELDVARSAWLNPNGWVQSIPEVVPGYPNRIVPVAGHEGDLKKRTLTHLYNAPPAWLRMLHDKLDAAVAQAYGWEWPLADDELLARLFALNQARAANQ